MLYSVDTNDYSHHFKSNNWLFIQSRDDNFTYLKNILPNKFDIIYLDTIHSAKHVKKMFYKFYKSLKIGGYFVIDDTSPLPYIKYREKNKFSFEINNQETYEILIEIYNENHKSFDLEMSYIGTGAAKITKLNNNELNIPKKIKYRKYSILNILRKIYLLFDRKIKSL